MIWDDKRLQLLKELVFVDPNSSDKSRPIVKRVEIKHSIDTDIDTDVNEEALIVFSNGTQLSFNIDFVDISKREDS